MKYRSNRKSKSIVQINQLYVVCKTVKGKGVSFMENQAYGMEQHQVKNNANRH